MEVTSHALDQSRVEGLTFAAGVFTNLAEDEHQDYHGTFEAYVRAKAIFFDHLAPGAPIIYEAGYQHLDRLIAEHPAIARLRPIGCGPDGPDVKVHPRATTRAGQRFDLELVNGLARIEGEPVPPMTLTLTTRLLGAPHLHNAALAAVAALCMGATPDDLRRGLSALDSPRRRMQLFCHEGRFVLDDTAYHPESFHAVFDVVERLPAARLHVAVAVRGQRGEEINRKDAEALAECCARVGAASLVVTSSADVLDEADCPSEAECRAFMAGLDGTPVRFVDRLQEAVDAVAAEAEEGDMIVLLGARGMRDGARLLGIEV
jgi:UDP-N-acetylmuramoyl-L-alanyl-D-glutamate--2,6-diaminopimelate ligase